jgi:hydrogenase maturation protease
MQEHDYLLIGVGNSLRQDDAAGLWLAQAVREALDGRGCTTQIRLVQQLLPEMAEEIGELKPHMVLVADCSADSDSATGGSATGQISRLPAADPPSTTSDVFGSHGLTATQLLMLARRLYGYTGEAWLATVPGSEFGHGEGLSPTTKRAIDHLTPQLIDHIT